MSGFDIDCSAFDDFAGDLRAAAEKVGKGIPGVVGHGALKVKNEWNQAFWDSEHFKGIGGTVSYDTRSGAGWVEAEVGPDKARHPGLPGPPKAVRAAPLANIAHFGGANGGGGTIADPQTFLDHEAPGFTKALGDLIDEALK